MSRARDAVVLLLLLTLAFGSFTAAELDAKRRRLEERVEGVAVEGARLAAATSGGLVLFSVEKPAEPRRLGGLLLPGGSTAAHLDGPRVYVASGAEGLSVIDASDPATPRLMARLETGGAVLDVVAGGEGHLVVADGSLGVKRVSVADPESPEVVAEVDTGGFARDLARNDDGLILAATGSRGLAILDMAATGGGRTVGRLASEDARGVAAGTLGQIWLADGASGLVLADASRPGEPREIDRLTFTPYEARDVALVGSLAVVALGRGGIAVVERTRTGLREVSRLPLSRPVVGLAPSGKILFLANDSGGVATVDLSRPSSPRLLTGDPGA